MWSLTPLRTKRISGPRKFRPSPQEDFFNKICHFRTHASQQFRGGGTASSSAQAAQGPFSGNGRPAAWVAADIVCVEDGKLAEHWDVPQDEATKAQSVSGLPMFGDRFPD